MTNLTRDPKGYYIALGIPEDADAEAIKSAYRSKAKRLHPDFNPSPIAAKQFHRLHEAYATLSDPDKRAVYDRPWKSDAKSAKARTDWFKPQAKKTASAAQDNVREAPADRSAKEKPPTAGPQTTIEPPAVCRCGKITAQPRYLIFEQVWGRLNKVQRQGLSGVYCRSCADRTAVRASLVTWLAGWWAWPDGPRETVKALLNNIRGGRKPPERNARLLMRQARAFRGRGEMELARNAAEQALGFAATPALRREVDQLLLSLSAHPARPLKNRWADPGWAATVQVLPLALVVAALSMAVTMSGPPSLDGVKSQIASVVRAAKKPIEFAKGLLPGAVAPQPAPGAASNAVGRVYSIATETTALRTGPGSAYQLVAMLTQGTVVLVAETDPSGGWYRVMTPDGAQGFVAVGALSPDVRVDALKDLGSFGKKE
ncbi:MAG: DnaJ domain-containing protein [Candidatus Binataceae bacterium]